MDYLRLLLAGLILLALGLGIGYYFAPDKIKTVEKIVTVEKKVVEEHTKTTKEYDPTTGKITKETDETGSKVTDSESTKTDKETEKTKDQKHYAVKVGVAKTLTNADSLVYRVGGELRLPFFNTWIGAEGDLKLKDPMLGIYGRMEF